MQSNDTKLIYILDDDYSIQRYLKSLLEKMGHTCKTFTTVEEIVEVLNKKEFPDLCFIDLNLNRNVEAEGYSLIQAIRSKITAEFPIIVISKQNSPDDIDRAFEVGAQEFIEKPIDPMVLGYLMGRYTESESSENFLLGKVPENISPCSTKEELKIAEVFETHLVLEADFYIAKQTRLKLDSELVTDIFDKDFVNVVVVSNTKDEQSGKFYVKVRFPDNEDYGIIIRKWQRNFFLNEVYC